VFFDDKDLINLRRCDSSLGRIERLVCKECGKKLKEAERAKLWGKGD